MEMARTHKTTTEVSESTEFVRNDAPIINKIKFLLASTKDTE